MFEGSDWISKPKAKNGIEDEVLLAIGFEFYWPFPISIELPSQE